jgi:hypothetical protein
LACGRLPGLIGVSSTAWRPLACPSGEAAFGPCSPPLAAARGSCGRDPAARLAAGSLAVLLPRTRRSVGASVSRRRCARWGPASSGAMAASPEGRMECPPPTSRRPCFKSAFLPKRKAITSASTRRGGGRLKPPSGRRPVSPERAGPERASRGGVSMAPTEGLSEGGEQRGAPPRDVPARSHAQARPRAALDVPPERHGRSPRGKTEQASRSEERHLRQLRDRHGR